MKTPRIPARVQRTALLVGASIAVEATLTAGLPEQWRMWFALVMRIAVGVLAIRNLFFHADGSRIRRQNK